MRRLLLWLRVVWLRYQVGIWDQMMKDEVRRNAEHPARMRSWHWQRAPYKAELDRLTGRLRIDYQHGPTMRNAMNKPWRSL